MNVAVLIASVFSLVSQPQHVTQAVAPLRGEYVEARTASVFAGPCHINGELMTTGNDAVMAWQFDSGVRVMAAVSAQANLVNESAARKSEIIIDDSASRADADAALASILSRDGPTLGRIISIRRAAISFRHEGNEILVESKGFAAMDVQSMPDDECCKQPNFVWYSPLAELTSRMVGYTVDAEYISARVGDRWQREDENGAFYGAFTY